MSAKKLLKRKPDDELSEKPRQYASPPCYQHEIDPLYQGISDDDNPPGDEATTNSTKAERTDKC